MLQDVFHPPEQLPIDDISSPISDQIFDFCDPDLFSDTLQNSEVTSSSNCCYEDNSSYTTTTTNNNTNNNSTIPPGIDKFNNYPETNNNNNNYNTTTTTTATSTTTTATTATTHTNTATNNLSIIFDSQDEIDNDISASIDFSPSPTFSIPQFFSSQQQYPFDFTSSSSSMQPQQTNPHHPIQIPSSLTDQTVVIDGSILSSLSQFPVDPVPPLLGPPSAATLPSVFDDDCLSSVPAYVAPNLNPSSPSCSFLGPGMGTYLPVTGTITGGLPPDGAGIFSGSILTGSSELQPQELDFQGDNAGIFSCNPDSMQRVFNTGDLQKALSGDSQQLVGAVSNSTPITSEMSSLEDSTFKVGKLSVEQRKEKIHRYMKKRNERNFSKKIKYACRKTLADSRPRVRGRFAKNDDFGEAHRTTSGNHEEDDDEEVVVKEEDELVDSDIFAHISGVNSFKCNYPIQSWI